MSSFPTVLLLAATGYVFVVGVLAIAVWMVVRSTRAGKGSGCTGCLIALALVVAAGLGAVGCTALTAIGLSNEAVRHGPVRSIEFDWDPPHAPGAPGMPGRADRDRFPVHMRIELDRPIDVARLSRWIRDEVEGDVALRYEVETGADGRPRAVLDLGLPIDRRDVEELRRELARELPVLDLPRAVRIEIRSADDDDDDRDDR
jgi:hypothetical protein